MQIDQKWQHDWVKSTLGHGEQMCSRCFITNREAAVLNTLNVCTVPPPKTPKETYWDDPDTYGASC